MNRKRFRISPPVARAIGWSLGIAAVLACVYLMARGDASTALGYAVAAVAFLWAISMVVSGDANPLHLSIGADGLLSVSKFQFLLWNAAVLFAYVWLSALAHYHPPAGAYTHDTFAMLSIPRNVLYAMGFSVATLATAKGITVSYLSGGRVSKPSQSEANIGNLVTSDDGTTPDLVKIQMLAWTVVAVFVFVAETTHNAACVGLSKCDPQVPDITTVLMVLMGLGQAAYLGNKLTSSDVPVLTNAKPQPLTTGQTLTISGSNLSGEVTTYFDSIPVATSIVPATSSASFAVTVPPKALLPTGSSIQVGAISATRYDVSIAVDGIQSANSLPVIVQ